MSSFQSFTFTATSKNSFYYKISNEIIFHMLILPEVSNEKKKLLITQHDFVNAYLNLSMNNCDDENPLTYTYDFYRF